MAHLMNNIFFADVKTEGSSGEEDSDDDEGGPNNVEVSCKLTLWEQKTYSTDLGALRTFTVL